MPETAKQAPTLYEITQRLLARIEKLEESINKSLLAMAELEHHKACGELLSARADLQKDIAQMREDIDA